MQASCRYKQSFLPTKSWEAGPVVAADWLGNLVEIIEMMLEGIRKSLSLTGRGPASNAHDLLLPCLECCYRENLRFRAILFHTLKVFSVKRVISGYDFTIYLWTMDEWHSFMVKFIHSCLH